MSHSQQRELSQALQGVKVETEPTAHRPSTDGPHGVWLSLGLQEPGGEGPGLRHVSSGHRAEEAQAVPGVKVSPGRYLGLRWLHPEGPRRFLLQVGRGQAAQEERPCPWSPPVTPAQTPVGGPTPVIRPLVEMSELRQPEADLQAPVQAQGPVEAQQFGAEGEEAASPSSSSSSSSYPVLFQVTLEEGTDAGEPSPPQSPSPTAMAAPPWSQSEDDDSSSQDEEGPSTWHEQEDADPVHLDPLPLKVADLVAFLLLKYRTKELTSKAEMLNMVLRDHRDHFPVVLSRASKCMQLVFGVDVKEVDPHECTYVLVPTLGLTCDAVLSDGQRPKAGLLVMLLAMIPLEGDHAPEEEVWELLSIMGVYAGKQHCIYGEPRELLTKVWVQEGYLEYRQVPHSDPARYEFLWGPRAYAETSKWQVLEYLLRVNGWDPRSFPSLCAEGVSDEAEGA
ncbi:melanoma-associated antigen 8-like [Megaptera novaeangliae]